MLLCVLKRGHYGTDGLAVTWPNFSFNVDLGQILVAGSVSALGYGLRHTYKFLRVSFDRVSHFVDRVNENDDLLDATTTVVDDHTRALIDADILRGPVVRLQRRKRSTDPAVFTKGDLA